jgi:hypothetical protein
MAKVEALCGRERSGSPQPEILSAAKELPTETRGMKEHGEREI